MTDIATLQKQLEQAGYIAEDSLAATLLLFRELKRPLLVEGDAGVGKTEIARALSRVLDRPLIRLQCYEGLDASSAVYEWNYQHQLLAIKLMETEHRSAEDKERHIFSEEFLLKRPLLKAITLPKSPVLLVDEIDRADEEFEAYLLEVLSDFQISIPELGTVTASSIPHVVLTSNGTRELSDALRRRCLYHYLDYPSRSKELAIIQRRVPEIGECLANHVVEFMRALRGLELRKRPGVSETLDWVAALLRLDIRQLDADPDLLAQTLVCLLKTKEDRDSVTPEVLQRLAANAL